MCIIVGEVNSVSNTQIVVADLAHEKRDEQLVVYANMVNITGAPVAMVLPFYNAEGRGVDVIATVPEDMVLFDMLKSATTVKSRSASLSANGFYDCAKEDFLEVQRAGAYRYSVAPLATDLVRADPAIFSNLQPDLGALFAEYQAAGFGFIVCIIDASASYAPFAYVSQRQADGGLFVPTRHHHSHPVSFTRSMRSIGEDWDHSVYVWNKGPGVTCTSMLGTPTRLSGVVPDCTKQWPTPSALRTRCCGLPINVGNIAVYRIKSNSHRAVLKDFASYPTTRSQHKPDIPNLDMYFKGGP